MSKGVLASTRWLPLVRGLTAASVVLQIGISAAYADESLPASNVTEPGTAIDPAVSSDKALGTVVVRARNREERLQDVPIPVSAVSGRELEQTGAQNISDFARATTNVQAAELNSRRSSVSIRGVGKNVNGEEYEAAVGVIIDNVFQSYVGSSWTNFPDLESIEIARGPQGTLLGKNTTLGVLNISTRKPSYDPSVHASVTVGERDLQRYQGSLTGPLVENTLAYRLAVFRETGDGSIESQSPQKPNATWYDRDRSGARLQFLLEPSDAWSARVILQSARARENINMSPFVEDPETFLDGSPRTGLTWSKRYQRDWFGGYQPLTERFRVDADYVTPSTDKQNGASVELNWDVEGHTITSISAYKDNKFVADNDFDKTRWDIRRGGGARTDHKQYSEELRLTSTNGGNIEYQTGLYGLYSTFSNASHTPFGRDAGAFFATNPQYATLSADAAGRELLGASLDGVYTRQRTEPSTLSGAIFGQADWHLTDQWTVTAGLRQTWERKENSYLFDVPSTGTDLDALGANVGASAAQIAAAKAVRASQLGSPARLGPKRNISNSSNDTSALLSPSFRLNDDVLLYASLGRGVKSGAVSWGAATGSPNITKPEQVIDLELGTKLQLLDRKLTLNVNLYNTDIKDFQAEQVIFDPTVVNQTTQIIGNAKKVVLRGVELDGLYAPLSSLLIRFGGAVNSAKYRDYEDAPCPSDSSAVLPPQCDYSGKQLPGAPKYSFNFGLEYFHPLPHGLKFNAFLNNSYTSKQNVALNLSEYGWEKARNITSAGIGVSGRQDAWSAQLFAKNLFDKVYAVDITSFTPAVAVSNRWGERRSVGVVLNARF